MSMKTQINARRTQVGGFLLEALIGVLIFSFGILGIVGLQAASLRHTGESEYRAEAMYYANSLISKMWTDDPAGLKTKYDSTVGGAGYVEFKGDVANLPGATGANVPIVLVDSAKDCTDKQAAPQPPSLQSHVVMVCVYWQAPGEADIHNYTTTGVVGANPT
jgi:type IV pilus assembly protein PilV